MFLFMSIVHSSGKMPMKPFYFPFPETRLFHSTKYVYKFKLRYGARFNVQFEGNSEHISEEIVASVRAVLANNEHPNPFATQNLIIFPYKSKWDSASRLRFKHGHRSLLPFPYVFTLYIEPKPLRDDQSPSYESSKNKHEQCVDEKIMFDKKLRKTDEAVQQTSNQQAQVSQDTCTSDDSTTKGGIFTFLTSLIPFQFLFSGRSSS
uniref:Membrane anchored junction protein n=1 Tax=Leptobrachium leishanense TaxID=445787 RepID=A0A8C5Q2U5_9ANUR